MELVRDIARAYEAKTPSNVRIIDLYSVALLLAAGVQVVYVFLVGTFPMNSFLAGFVSCMGGFVLAHSLRQQIMSPHEFGGISAQRAFVEFLFANLILSLAVLNYMG